MFLLDAFHFHMHIITIYFLVSVLPPFLASFWPVTMATTRQPSRASHNKIYRVTAVDLLFLASALSPVAVDGEFSHRFLFLVSTISLFLFSLPFCRRFSAGCLSRSDWICDARSRPFFQILAPGGCCLTRPNRLTDAAN